MMIWTLYFLSDRRLINNRYAQDEKLKKKFTGRDAAPK
jgi:hypothetical protein